MNADQFTAVDSRRQALLGRLTAAEAALRNGLPAVRGFDGIARARMERARAHIQEACAAIHEAKAARNVRQPADGLHYLQQAMENTRPGRPQRI